MRVAPHRETTITAVVHADRLALQPGPFSFEILLRNSANELNVQRVELSGCVAAAVGRRELTIERRSHASTLTVSTLNLDGVDKSGGRDR